MHLIFFDIHARSLPGEIAENAVYHPMQFNYCVGGRIEMLLDDNSYIYLKEKDFCISRQTSQSESYFQMCIRDRDWELSFSKPKDFTTPMPWMYSKTASTNPRCALCLFSAVEVDFRVAASVTSR